MSLGKRLKQILRKLDLTQVALSKRINISNVVINRYIKDKTMPDLNFLNKLATNLNININWLITGEGTMFPTRNVKQFGDREFYYMPIFESVSCGSPQEIESAEPLDHILVDTNSLSGDFNSYFSFFASGDSMEPYISNGDVVIVKQDSEWQHAEDRICVVNVEGEITLKKVKTFMDGQEILLQPYNKDHQPILLDKERARNSLLVGIAVMSVRNL
ncbi:MAG: XRE family transcriptional regulator [Candidatus Cloacimonetes bacterium]|nr:XRE family transcriptional regulator [Candidatus Cloacimonadota bacterium]MCF7815098.1 XRE family transcriptional regulator [Candidatus Cloacimonadota bacterium]MCF7869322.1 XRE family transcriptional regulator [Candidatus Cloacimonadota bacterium]MCF7884726.1 XRE family transcriptional regulator [Candidatus Cloacimonadota bacterium]